MSQVYDQKKFLDYKGIQYLWSKISLEDYPNNALLMTVINAIDETKADRNEIPTTPEAVGADPKGAALESLIEAKAYADTAVAALVNSAPETLDTLGELATAFEENQEVVEALDASITNKQDKVSDTLILVDAITGSQYKIQIQNGQLVSFPVE